MSDEEFKINVENPSMAGRRTRRQQPGPWKLILALLAIVVAASVLYLLTANREELPAQAAKDQNAAKQALQQPTELDSKGIEPNDMVVADDGQSLWVSPTDGKPFALNYLPAGTQALLHLHLNDLLMHREGEKVMDSLGPWGKEALATIERWTGLKVKEIKSLYVSLYPSDSGSVETSLRVELINAWDDHKLSQRFVDAPQREQQGQNYFLLSDRVCFLPKSAGGKLLVSVPQAIFVELLEQGDAPTLFPRDFERVLGKTDIERMATLVISNKFVQYSGQKFLQGSAAGLKEVFVDMFRDDAAVVALSCHWDENFFWEIRSTVNLNQRPYRYAAAINKRLSNYPDAVEKTLVGNPQHLYGQAIVEKLPQMLRLLSRYTRSAEIDRMTVVRCYLPAAAGHNLLLAAELALQDFAAEGETELAQSKSEQSLAERLQQTTSLAFPKETLQKALEMLSEDIEVPIQIAGGDLQLEGITKNQSLGLELRDRPANEILLEVLLRANPDRTASGANDPKQKLVYVLDEAAGVVIVTTRSAAKKRNDKLPVVFNQSN